MQEILTLFVAGVKTTKDKQELADIISNNLSLKEREEVLHNIIKEDSNNIPDFLGVRTLEDIAKTGNGN